MTTRLPPRRRRKPVHPMPVSMEEERLVQQAIENSKKMTKLKPGGDDLHITAGPTFYPTVEEFEGNPLHYISKIRSVAEKYGVCKIVPPKGWNPPFSVNMASKKNFSTKEQLLHRIQEGISFGDGEEYNVSDYLTMAMDKTKSWIEENVKDDDGNPAQTVSLEYLEKCYWNLVEISHERHTVEYMNDIDSHELGSGFPRSERGRAVESDAEKRKRERIDSGTDGREKKHSSEPKFGTEEFYKESYWNLSNIPNCPGSILKYIKVGINGINVPWMYFGNLFSTFCWHNEDNYLYSINYHHWGAPKIWYGVPGTKKDAEGLEHVFKSYLSMKMRDVPDLLHHITTMFSPRLLQSADVPVYRLQQHPGEFVVTFPRSFHGGFSMGPNAGEAVNFATRDWIVHGADASERYRSFARPAVFSHDRLTFTMANHLEEQTSYETCKLLSEELKRIITEELTLRTKLLDSGIRDVSKYVQLPKNRLDQLDEDSADYDDKRLCYSCKHICFFSCVACECSKSKVSCLRHSHFMCRCPLKKKYMMIWSSEEEMYNALQEVVKLADKLKGKGENNQPPSGDEARSRDEKEGTKEKDSNVDENQLDESDTLSPGTMQDKKNHEAYVLDLKSLSIANLPRVGQRLRHDTPACPKRKKSDEIIEDSIEPCEKKIKKDLIPGLTEDDPKEIESTSSKEQKLSTQSDKSKPEKTKSEENTSLESDKLNDEFKRDDQKKEDEEKPSVGADCHTNADTDMGLVNKGNDAQSPPVSSLDKKIGESTEENIDKESTNDAVPAGSVVDEAKKGEMKSQDMETIPSTKSEEDNELGTLKEGSVSTNEVDTTADSHVDNIEDGDGKSAPEIADE